MLREIGFAKHSADLFIKNYDLLENEELSLLRDNWLSQIKYDSSLLYVLFLTGSLRKRFTGWFWVGNILTPGLGCGKHSFVVCFVDRAYYKPLQDSKVFQLICFLSLICICRSNACHSHISNHCPVSLLYLSKKKKVLLCCRLVVIVFSPFQFVWLSFLVHSKKKESLFPFLTTPTFHMTCL